MDDNKRYHYEIKKRKRFDLFPLPLSFLSPSLSSQLFILKSESGFLFHLKKKIFLNFKIHGIYVLRGIHAPFCSHARGPFMGGRGSRKTGRNLRARINFNRVINAAHRHGKIWIEHAAAREGRAKNNISVRLLWYFESSIIVASFADTGELAGNAEYEYTFLRPSSQPSRGGIHQIHTDSSLSFSSSRPFYLDALVIVVIDPDPLIIIR